MLRNFMNNLLQFKLKRTAITTGFAVDTVVRSVVLDWALDDVGDKSKVILAIDILNAIDTRHNVDFRYYQSGLPFKYYLLRMLYLEKRKMDVTR
jgi:phospholipid-binding lipoprotein MlaA